MTDVAFFLPWQDIDRLWTLIGLRLICHLNIMCRGCPVHAGFVSLSVQWCLRSTQDQDIPTSLSIYRKVITVLNLKYVYFCLSCTSFLCFSKSLSASDLFSSGLSTSSQGVLERQRFNVNRSVCETIFQNEDKIWGKVTFDIYKRSWTLKALDLYFELISFLYTKRLKLWSDKERKQKARKLQ